MAKSRKGRLRRVSEPGLPALPQSYLIEVMQDAELELPRTPSQRSSQNLSS